MITSNYLQDISKLGGGESFRKTTRSQAWYQTWSPPKNQKVYHTRIRN